MNPASNDYAPSAAGLGPGAAAAPAAPAPVPAPDPPARDCIIVADAAEWSLATMRRILSSHFDILEARSGTDIVQILRAPPRAISAVILDLVLPIMDGFRVMEFMQQNGLLGLIPVIVVTAISDAQSLIQSYVAGAADVIAKPVDPDFFPFKLRWNIHHFRHLHALSAHPVAHAQVEQLEALLSSLPAAIFVEDATTGVLLHCNENFLRFRGVPENPVGQPTDALPLAPGMHSALRAAREAILVDNLSKPVLYHGADTGNTYSILYRTFVNPVSNLTQLLCFITNVTYEVQEINTLENHIRDLERQVSAT